MRGPPPSSSAHARNVALHEAGPIVRRGWTWGRALVPNALGRRRRCCPIHLNNSIPISHPSMTLPTRSTMLRDVYKQRERLRAPLQAGEKMAGELAVAKWTTAFDFGIPASDIRGSGPLLPEAPWSAPNGDRSAGEGAGVGESPAPLGLARWTTAPAACDVDFDSDTDIVRERRPGSGPQRSVLPGPHILGICMRVLDKISVPTQRYPREPHVRFESSKYAASSFAPAATANSPLYRNRPLRTADASGHTAQLKSHTSNCSWAIWTLSILSSSTKKACLRSACPIRAPQGPPCMSTSTGEPTTASSASPLVRPTAQTAAADRAAHRLRKTPSRSATGDESKRRSRASPLNACQPQPRDESQLPPVTTPPQPPPARTGTINVPEDSESELLNGRQEQPYNRYRHSDVDYEAKYKADAYGEELGPQARVWNVYNDEAQMADAEMVKGMNGSIDVLLVFAGLFSAVVTTFVAQSSQKLDSDYGKIIASLVYESTRVQRALATGTPIEDIPVSQLSFDSQTQSRGDLWVNGLWFTSLLVSLLTALVSVVAKQWIQQFNSMTGGSPRDHAYARQYRFWSFNRWNVPFIIGCLPVLLTIALLLFFAGLAVYAAPLDSVISLIIIAFSTTTLLLYAATVVMPILVPHCAYRTQIADYILAVRKVIIHLPSWILAICVSLLAYVFNLVGCKSPMRPRFPVHNLHSADLKSREKADIEKRNEFLAASSLRWLCNSSYSVSAVHISAQAFSALPITFRYMQSSEMEPPALDLLSALEKTEPQEVLSSHQKTAERLARAILHLPYAAYHLARSRLWEALTERWGFVTSPQLDAGLRVMLLVRLCGDAGAWGDLTLLIRVRQAVDTSKFSAETAILHPIIWRWLFRMVRAALRCLQSVEGSEEPHEWKSIMEWELKRIRTTINYICPEDKLYQQKPPVSATGDLLGNAAGGLFENASGDLFENTAISLADYAACCSWKEAPQILAENMDKLRGLLSTHMRRVEAERGNKPIDRRRYRLDPRFGYSSGLSPLGSAGQRLRSRSRPEPAPTGLSEGNGNRGDIKTATPDLDTASAAGTSKIPDRIATDGTVGAVYGAGTTHL
ncbi:uncharacterized protein SCHCODRAFT_02544909 [Schizophyllum commune H4-8]|uniref:DUF6535 domain-containing protein n=1 Tax=Schizophyllum commune (strain H4-8 / FGSC 9210) TaxID=578458 RepID=D8Q7F6_SCHCM|nr:uncharacterized protein SCHCODRAFT_02544909 [Schizophyllum commune H4-8]KAI5891514.1 hypothetical protein SCHCODRAFT_02544909 [Schizophyllum commune H4-8]